MKRNLTGIGIVFFFIIMLVSPKAVFNGASEGLLLWFQIILPTLFPFLIITNLLIRTDSIHWISDAAGPVICRIFRVSKSGSFAVIAGFLCGYPMGAKVTADLTDSGQISADEGRYLLSFCNNTSPVFILNYIVWKTLQREDLLAPSMIILFGAPVAVSFFTRKYYLKGRHSFRSMPAAPEKKKWDFKIVDACIMDSFEAITKVGGYIILFSVILTLMLTISAQLPFVSYLLPALEVTNGITMIGHSKLPLEIQYPALMGLTSFGGICSIAQTQCMIQKCALPILPYIIEKLAAALAASLFAVLYLVL